MSGKSKIQWHSQMPYKSLGIEVMRKPQKFFSYDWYSSEVLSSLEEPFIVSTLQEGSHRHAQTIRIFVRFPSPRLMVPRVANSAGFILVVEALVKCSPADRCQNTVLNSTIVVFLNIPTVFDFAGGPKPWNYQFQNGASESMHRFSEFYRNS